MVLQEFLSRLGFQVDGKSKKDFFESLDNAATKAMALGKVVTVMAGGVYAGLVKVASGQAELAALSGRIKASVKDIEELIYVSSQMDSSADAVKGSLERLARISGEAFMGKGAGKDYFAKLKISLKDANGELKNSTTLLYEVGQKLKGYSESEQIAIMEKLGIDRSMMRAITSDVAGLRDEFAQMYAVAATDADKAAQAASGFMDEVGKLGTMAMMVAKAVSLQFIGKIKGDIERLRKTIMENFGAIQKILQTVIAIILRLAGFVGAMAYRVIQWLGSLVAWFADLDEETQSLVLTVGGLLAAWKLLNLGFLMTPLGMILTGLVALALAVDDLMTYLEGGESLMDWGDWIGYIDQAKAALQPLISALKNLGNVVFPIVMGAIEKLWNFGKAIFTAFAQVIADAFGDGTGDAAWVLQALANDIQWLAGIIGTVFEAVAPVAVEAFRMALAGIIDFLRMLFSVFVGVAQGIASLFTGDLTGAANAFLGVLKSVWDFLGKLIGRVVDFVKGVGGKILAKLGFDVGDMERIAESAAATEPTGNGPALGPTPATQAAVENKTANATITQETNITVTGTNDPNATGKAVAGQQGRVNDNLVRNTRGAVQ